MTEDGARARMSTEERREQLLAAGAKLLALRAQEDVSTEMIAEAAGVSRGLLYHYFPTKQDFILAALERGQRQLQERLTPDPELDPVAQFDASLEILLDYVEEHARAYMTIFSVRGGGDPKVAAALNAGRSQQLDKLLEALRGDEAAQEGREAAALEIAVQGWLFFFEGAVLRWLEEGGLERSALKRLLRSSLGGALRAAHEAVGAKRSD